MSIIAEMILFILAVLVPPAVAHIKTGRKDLTLNIVLTLFGWLPGILHAWYLMFRSYDHRQQAVEPLTDAAYVEGPHREAQTSQYIQPQPQLQSQPQPKPEPQWPSDAKHPPTYAH